jgi:hypothetical protein
MMTENDIFESFEMDLRILFRNESTLFVKKIETDFSHLGIREYLHYFYWVLLHQRDKWPSMPPHAEKILSHMRWMLPEGQDFPRDYKNYTIPSIEVEEKIDAYLIKLARWCEDSFTSHLWFEFQQLLKSYVPEYAKIYPDESKIALEGHLRISFQVYVEQNDTLGMSRLMQDIFFAAILF